MTIGLCLCHCAWINKKY